MTERLVVIGADAAGMTAASQARRRRGADDLSIVAFERGRHTSYSACGIPYWIGGQVGSADDLVARSPEQHRERDIDVRIRHEVIAIDLDRREVVARDLDGGGELRECFDQLMIGTGATPIRPDWPGVDARGVHGVQTLDDGEDVHDTLDRNTGGDAKRAVVVGGGYIGVELAESMVRRGLSVTLLERAAQPMPTLDPDMGALVHKAMEGLGIDVRSGVTVEGIEVGADGWVRAAVTDGEEFPADIVVLGLGTRPNSTLASEAGLPVGWTGGILTDRRMRVPKHDGIWAGGDCVETVHRVTGQPVSIPLGTHANKQGRVAGINLGGGYATFPGVVGTAVSKVCDLEIARTGLTEREAQRAGFAFVTATIESDSRAGYYPDAQRMTVKLLAEPGTGRLLGGQIVGREGAAKRIDVLAVALWNEMTVDEMIGLDLGYAPPFSPVWDPVLVAARKAADACRAD
jgi:NADPH-dependent 2,4-dienoyl-CoA reductase/sulfur reductase-like enzyme